MTDWRQRVETDGYGMIIDAHAHFVPQPLIDDLVGNKHPAKSVKISVENGGVRLAFGGNDAKRPIPRGMETADARQKWLVAHGIDKQVVGGWLDMFAYEIPAEEGLRWSRLINKHLAKAAKDEPRFIPLATVPLQDGARAAEVLKEAHADGFMAP